MLSVTGFNYKSKVVEQLTITIMNMRSVFRDTAKTIEPHFNVGVQTGQNSLRYKMSFIFKKTTSL